jgi:hypothetical protein
MSTARSLLSLASDLKLADHPTVDELITAAKAARALRLRIIKEHVQVTEAAKELMAGLDEDHGDDVRDATGSGGDDEFDPDAIAQRAERRRGALDGLLALGDPTRLRRLEFVAFCELDILRSVVLPALVQHGNSDVAALTVDTQNTGGFFIEVMKLLAALTMPIPQGSDELPRQIDCLKRVRSAVSTEEVLAFVVAAVAPIASSRLHGPLPKASAATIEVTLALVNNLLKAPIRESEFVVGAMCRSHAIELLLVVLRQNSAKLEEALLEAYRESGNEADRDALRGLIGDGQAGARAADATSALAASLRGDDPQSASRVESSAARYSEEAAAIASRDSRIPFPQSPGRSTPFSSVLLPSTPEVHRSPMRSGGRSVSEPGSSAAVPDPLDPIAAVLASPRKSPRRPSAQTPERRVQASPLARRSRSREVQLPVPPQLESYLAEDATLLNIESATQPPFRPRVLDPFAGEDDDAAIAPPDSSPAMPVLSAVPPANPNSFVAPSPAPYTPVPSAAMPQSERADSEALHAPAMGTLPPGDEDDVVSHVASSRTRPSATRLSLSSSDEDEDEEDGLAIYEKHGKLVDGSESEEEEESDAESAVYDEEGRLIVTEKDLRRDRVLAKLFADDQRRVRGESVVTLRRWNLLILEACALVFRSAPAATLATLGFGVEMTGSATDAAKKAIAQRLASQTEEMSRWRDAIRRRQGATNSSALLVQRAEAPAGGGGGGSRLTAVGEANRSLTAKSQLESAQEVDARKRKKFRRKLLQSHDESAVSMLPLQTQVQLAQQYRQFAQFGFTNLSTMLWPELHRRVNELKDSVQTVKETMRTVKDNDEGPLINALDRVELGDVLNYAALTTTMLRFGRVSLRLRQAARTDEAQALIQSGGFGESAEERERAAFELVDHAMLPVATEVLTLTRLESALSVLEALLQQKDLRKSYDYLVALNFVAELFRVLVHSVDGDLAPSEAVRIAATSLASSIIFNPQHIKTVLFSANLVDHAGASVRQVEATLRALHATMLLLDRVSYDGKVHVQVQSKRVRRNADEDGEDVGEGDEPRMTRGGRRRRR